MPAEFVLIVDDNPQNLKLARLLLISEGYQVRTAADAEEALRVLDSFSPRLTTIDLPKHELGAAAARLLIERLAKGTRGAPRTIRLPSAMRIRESCGCALRGRAALVR